MQIVHGKVSSMHKNCVWDTINVQYPLWILMICWQMVLEVDNIYLQIVAKFELSYLVTNLSKFSIGIQVFNSFESSSFSIFN